MNSGIYSAVSASMTALDRLDVLTNNLANANTVGFKAQLTLQRGELLRGHDPRRALVTKGEVVTDFSQGTIEKTGHPYHLALRGDGYFLIDTPAGERLTRRGTFDVDSEGFLVSAEGARVQGPDGDINLGPLRPDAIAIGADGRIRAGQEELGRIRVVEADPDRLVRDAGASFYAPPDAIVDATHTRIQQGSLERSNVSAIEELVGLIETMRAFEAYTKASQQHDTVTQRAVTDVGRG